MVFKTLSELYSIFDLIIFEFSTLMIFNPYNFVENLFDFYSHLTYILTEIFISLHYIEFHLFECCSNYIS